MYELLPGKAAGLPVLIEGKPYFLKNRNQKGYLPHLKYKMVHYITEHLSY